MDTSSAYGDMQKVESIILTKVVDQIDPIMWFYVKTTFRNGMAGHHVWKSQASDESLAKNDDLEPRERFVLWGKNIRQGAPL